MFGYERLKHLDKRRVAKVRRLLNTAAIKVKPRRKLKLSEHEDDNRIYECSEAGKCTISSPEYGASMPHAYTKIITARHLLRLADAGQI